MKIRSAAAAAMLGVSALMMTATPAAFAQTIAQPAYDADHDVTLTLHKYVQEDGQTPGEVNDGGEALAEEPTGSPVEGVEFSVQLLKGSTEKIKTDEGLKELLTIAQSLKDDSSIVESIEVEGSATAQSTGANGQTVFTGLAQGAYLVRETSVENAKVDSGTLVPGKPFIAFLPTTNKEGTQWNYDVHAYPKNSRLQVTKEFTDSLNSVPQAGHDISYNIFSGIPKVTEGHSMAKYIIKDTLKDQLKFKSVKVYIGSDSTSWEEIPAGELQVDSDTQDIQITFLEAALQRLNTVPEGTKVKTELTTLVVAAVDPSSTQNTATVITNNGDGNGDTTTDGDTPEGPVYAKLKITKIKDGDTETKLQGAEFKLFMCYANTGDIQNPGSPISTLAVDNDKTPEVVKDTFVTDQDGQITFQGLQKLVSEDDTVDPRAINNPNNELRYCLKETKAPNGYALRKEPFLISTFDKASTGSFVEGVYSVDVPNSPREDLNLPLTGGAGYIPLVLLLTAAGGGAAFVATRRKKELNT